jgi:hypothetical protein
MIFSVEQLKETFGAIQSVCLLRPGSDSASLAIGTRLNYILWKDLRHEQIDVIMRVSESMRRRFSHLELIVGTHESVGVSVLSKDTFSLVLDQF